jgi:hypothetical protein
MGNLIIQDQKQISQQRPKSIKYLIIQDQKQNQSTKTKINKILDNSKSKTKPINKS